jgi:hypothetical protein
MVNIWVSAIAKDKIQVGKQVGVKEKNAVGHGVGLQLQQVVIWF